MTAYQRLMPCAKRVPGDGLRGCIWFEWIVAYYGRHGNETVVQTTRVSRASSVHAAGYVAGILTQHRSKAWYSIIGGSALVVAGVLDDNGREESADSEMEKWSERAVNKQQTRRGNRTERREKESSEDGER
ncbi:hypothetical protein NDU88_009679 [Pleurodeles waltl]|uniref:Uncharacterized protein n=1 Tax=Pleurodeles waltl TaxID=8319 RepID=A0AAV7PVY6_PLEWA|nr:hypothetical protein NDU88_009679 [Pleurodeles waltl]